MAKLSVSVSEQAFAKRLLKLLGISAKYQKSPSSIVAITVWTRYIAKSTGGRFNNIFGIGPKLYGTSYVKPHYKVYKGKDGNYYYKFPTRTAAIKELVRIFKVQGRPSGSPVNFMRLALSRGHGRDFLTQLAMSSFNVDHFGTDGSIFQADSAKNKLWKMYTGNQWSLLAKAIRKIIRTRREVVIAGPSYLQPPAQMHQYIDGWAAGHFYEQRHPKVQ